ncbi:MAG: inositol monophosphatase family protein [Actinomycetota bacterium]
MNPTDLLDLARRAARGAGELLLERFRGAPRGVESKSTPTDLVSDADLEADRFLQAFISTERPDDGFITEESAGRDSTSGLVWVLDPLDGTVNYLFRIPWWSVSVAVEDADGIVAGAVFHPSLDEMFTATRGGGAFLNGEPILVSERDDLPKAMIATGFSYDASVRAVQAKLLTHLLPRVRDVRRNGSAALDLCGVACGRFDGYYESATNHWDTAAGSLIVREAGGSYSETVGPGQFVLATNGELHDELLALVSG